MKWSMASVGVIVLGIIGVMVIVLFQQLTTSSENDYYLLKEITEASMIESIDLKYYRETGDLKIVKEKFVENFIRRFAENATLNKNYKINFYSIYEVPPMVSVEIKAKTGEFHVGDESINADITTRITAILERN